MRVIKKGREQYGWSQEFECTGVGNGGGGCGALLLVEWRDLFKTYRSVYREDPDVYITFKCCECGVLTDIKGPRFWNDTFQIIPNEKDIPDQSRWEKQNPPIT